MKLILFTLCLCGQTCLFAAQCERKDGMDIDGVDLEPIYGQPEEACCDLCKNHWSGKCKAYAWNDHQGGTCWLKESTLFIPKENVKAGIVWPSKPDQCETEDGMDIEGPVLESINRQPEEACCELCSNHWSGKCKAYAWNDHEGGTCWLKESTQLIPMENVKAGIVRSSGTCSIIQETDVDYYGNDIRGVSNIQAANECCPLCEEESGCVVFTYRKSTKTCWLKHTIGSRQSCTDDCVSGRKSGTSSCQQPIGINYSPFHNQKYVPDHGILTEALNEDFARISAAGFCKVRTFYSAFYGMKFAKIAKDHGLTLALGVYMFNDHWDWTDSQMEFAAESAENYPVVIDAIFIGNENVQPAGPYTSDHLIGMIRQLKGMLSSRNVGHIPVGTVQRYTEWQDPNREDIRRLADECDVIGANLYPFFGGGGINNAIGTLQDQLNVVKNRFPGKRVDITETGWPSGGGICPSSQETTICGEYRGQDADWLRAEGRGLSLSLSFMGGMA